MKNTGRNRKSKKVSVFHSQRIKFAVRKVMPMTVSKQSLRQAITRPSSKPLCARKSPVIPNAINYRQWLEDVLIRINTMPASQIDSLLPQKQETSTQLRNIPLKPCNRASEQFQQESQLLPLKTKNPSWRIQRQKITTKNFALLNSPMEVTGDLPNTAGRYRALQLLALPKTNSRIKMKQQREEVFPLLFHLQWQKCKNVILPQLCFSALSHRRPSEP